MGVPAAAAAGISAAEGDALDAYGHGATFRRRRHLRLRSARPTHQSEEPFISTSVTRPATYCTGCGSLVFCQNELKYSLGDMYTNGWATVAWKLSMALSHMTPAK
jgi:hypothetical protein